MTPLPPPTAGAFLCPCHRVTIAEPVRDGGQGRPPLQLWGGDPIGSPLTLARCPVNTYRVLITGPRTGRRVDTVQAASLQAAVAMIQQQARLFDSGAAVAPLHDPCPFG